MQKMELINAIVEKRMERIENNKAGFNGSIL